MAAKGSNVLETPGRYALGLDASVAACRSQWRCVVVVRWEAELSARRNRRNSVALVIVSFMKNNIEGQPPQQFPDQAQTSLPPNVMHQKLELDSSVSLIELGA